jgi:hypothetical protein
MFFSLFSCKSFCNLTTMSFSTPPRYSRPHRFLVERTNRKYALYIPPSPTFSSDSDAEPESLADNQSFGCGLDPGLGMSQIQSSYVEELELPAVSFYMCLTVMRTQLSTDSSDCNIHELTVPVYPQRFSTPAHVRLPLVLNSAPRELRL